MPRQRCCAAISGDWEVPDPEEQQDYRTVRVPESTRTTVPYTVYGPLYSEQRDYKYGTGYRTVPVPGTGTRTMMSNRTTQYPYPVP